MTRLALSTMEDTSGNSVQCGSMLYSAKKHTLLTASYCPLILACRVLFALLQGPVWQQLKRACFSSPVCVEEFAQQWVAECSAHAAEVARLQQRLADTEGQLAFRDIQLGVRDTQLANRDAQLAVREAEIRLLQQALAEMRSAG